MVKERININQNTNRVLNIVKAKYGLKNKSEALNLVVKYYGENLLESGLRHNIQRNLGNKKSEAFQV